MRLKLLQKTKSEALDNGELDNLSLSGQPLDLDDGQFVPLHLRLSQKILRNAGYLPPVLQLKRKFCSFQSALPKQPTNAREIASSVACLRRSCATMS